MPRALHCHPSRVDRVVVVRQDLLQDGSPDDVAPLRERGLAD